MNFMLIPSLEHIALVNVAASLWNQQDVRTLVIKFKNSRLFVEVERNLYYGTYVSFERKEKWLKIEEKVLEKVPQLLINTILKEKILGFIQAVGLQILRWMEYHHRYMNCFYDFVLPDRFLWTPQGIVDKKKTAELLVKDESIDVITRFSLACIYCLENDIPKLWNRIPESNQENFIAIKDIGENMQKDLLIFWWMYLRGEIDRLGRFNRQILNIKCSAYRHMFRSAANGGNKAATEYFLQKIFPRKKSLFKTALHVINSRREGVRPITNPPNEYYSEVFCFLLWQMSDEQQVIFKKLNGFNTLLCFLDWPWQIFFVNVACRVCNFFSGPTYNNLLRMLIHKVIFRCTDYNYQKIFRELWQQSLDSHKRFIMNETIGGILNLLLEINDKESLKLVIQDATLAEKNTLIFSDRGQGLCQRMLRQPDLLKYFIQLLISSKDGMIKFKQEYEEFIERLRDFRKIDDCKHTEFLKLLDDLARVYDKRKNLDEGNGSTSKRVCTVGLMEGDT